jgi:hypothetical protein
LAKKQKKGEVYYVECAIAVKAKSHEEAAERARQFIIALPDGPTQFHVARGADTALRYVELRHVVLGD